ncbi:serine hydrolase domain-containing protein [Parasphingorhabdus sp.]|uniref:serine hydrolase domain-containing protein n=1 Tax=Parasphingorhabdus sp. TaxID=2709688 RepID=UPI003BAF961D
MEPKIEIGGQCSDRFVRLAQEFRANFENGSELGAAMALYVDGELVVDMWAGFLDPDRTLPWQKDALVNVWSTTKGVAAACFALIVDRGFCGYDDPVETYWPEFAAGEKADVTIAQLLSHQAGLSAFASPTTVDDFFKDPRILASRLARQTPLWPPGTQSGYHGVTIGFLAAELFRRIEGRRMKLFVDEEFAALDIHIGIEDEELNRVATIIPPPESDAEAPDMDDLQSVTLGNPFLMPDAANLPEWRQAEIPSVNGFASARGLASLYSSLLTGSPELSLRLSPETLGQATMIRSSGVDAILAVETNWAAGFLRNSLGIYGPNSRAFGHSGWGGSFAFADPDNELAFSYVMNAMGSELVGDPRTLALLREVYQAL